jgi:hypothetical protein
MVLDGIFSDYGPVNQTQQVLFNIDADLWSWFWLIVGAGQIASGVLILRRHVWGLWFGVVWAGLSALFTIFTIFAWPVWSAGVLLLDLLVLYGLVARSEEFSG